MVVPVTAVEARLAGSASSLLGEDIQPVDPSASFEVRLPLPVRGARLVLLDSRDSMVPSGSESEVGATSRYTLVPLEPLAPGARYVLRLEGLESRLLRSDDGRLHDPLVVPVRVAGEAPPAPPKKAKKKRVR